MIVSESERLTNQQIHHSYTITITVTLGHDHVNEAITDEF